MTEREYRLIASALRLGRFTPASIGMEAGVSENVARSWVRHNPRYIEADPFTMSPQSSKRVLPTKKWRVRRDADQEMREILASTYPLGARPAAFEMEKTGHLRNLTHLEREIAEWHAARVGGDEVAAGHLNDRAKAWVAACWRDFAALDVEGHSVSQRHLERLAGLERELGSGEPPAEQALPRVALWLAQRIRAMVRQGASAPFAARAVWARASVRPSVWQQRLSASAVGAQVWTSEGLAQEAGIEGSDLTGYAQLLCKLVPGERRRDDLISALDSESTSFCRDLKDRQALTIGAALLQPESFDCGISLWLASLPVMRYWSPAMAPAMVYGLNSERFLDRSELIRTLADAVREAGRLLQQWRMAPSGSPEYWLAGDTRTSVIHYAMRQVADHSPNPERGSLHRRGAPEPTGWAYQQIPYEPHFLHDSSTGFLGAPDLVKPGAYERVPPYGFRDAGSGGNPDESFGGGQGFKGVFPNESPAETLDRCDWRNESFTRFARRAKEEV